MRITCSRWSRISARLLVGGLSAVVLVACGGDDEPSEVATATLGRYCELSTQLELMSAGSGAASAPGVFDGSPEAISSALAQMGPTVDELVDSAPGDIDGDVETVIEALKAARGGDIAELGREPFTEASAKVLGYNQANCRAASEPGGDL